MIKTFRGLIANGGQDTINLHTNDGKTGYRIVKFEVMMKNPGIAAQESIVQVWKVIQTSVPTELAVVDFSNGDLLGAALGFYGSISGNTLPILETVIFDNEIFNQDIFITHTDNHGAAECNYYLELEQISLDLNESTVATLQSIRNA